LYDDQKHSDVSLEVGEKLFPVHKLILSASSDVFDEMLLNPTWSEHHKNTVVLEEDSDCVEVFEEFLRYLYSGSIEITSENVLPLLKLGDKYIVQDLSRSCKKYMTSHIMLAAEDDLLLTWYSYCLLAEHEATRDQCTTYILSNFQLISICPSFINLDKAALEALLKSSDLIIVNELALFRCVERWLDAAERRMCVTSSSSDDSSNMGEQLLPVVKEVMAYVRIPMMTPAEIGELSMSSLVQRFSDYFIQRMASAMAFQKGQRLPAPVDQLTPRIYTDEKWCAYLVVENWFDTFVSNPVQSWELTFPSELRNRGRTLEYNLDLKVNPNVLNRKPAFSSLDSKKRNLMDTLAMTITSMDGEKCKVDIRVLVLWRTDESMHVVKVIKQPFSFSVRNSVIAIDGFNPFDEDICKFTSARDLALRVAVIPRV
jgi:hypothetical protein